MSSKKSKVSSYMNAYSGASASRSSFQNPYSNPSAGANGGKGNYDSFIRYRNISILTCIVILVGFFLFFRNNLKATSYVEFLDGQMELTSYQGDELYVNYADIISVELTDEVDFGDPTDEGYDTIRGTGGIWQSDTYGTYHLITAAKAKDYIVLETATGYVIFNYESTQTTDDIYTGLTDLLPSEGYSDITFTSYLQ